MQTRSILRPLAATRPSFHTSGLAGPSGAVATRLDGLIDHIQLRMRLAGAALRFRVAALATTPRVLFSVLRGRTEPTIPANTDFGRLHTQPDYSVVTAGSPEELKAHLVLCLRARSADHRRRFAPLEQWTDPAARGGSADPARPQLGRLAGAAAARRRSRPDLRGAHVEGAA
jgi:hypothetical protein